MNTITTVTHTYNEFIQQHNLDTFKSLVILFKEKAKKDGLSSAEHILYNLIRGLKINRGFSNEKEEFTEGFKQAKRDLKFLLTYKATQGFLASISSTTITAYSEQLSKKDNT